jgi:hypothetical protein
MEETDRAEKVWEEGFQMVAADQARRIKVFYESAQQLSDEIGIDLKTAFWAHVTMYAQPEMPSTIYCQQA